MLLRILTQHKVARIAQTEVGGFVQAFGDVAALAELASRAVLFLLCCAHFEEGELDVAGELEGGAVKGAGFGFGEARLVL